MDTSDLVVTEFDWKTPEGVRLHAVEWRPPQPRAVAVLVHGLGEHCRRYNHVATALGSADIAMVGFDHRGHGLSEGKRGHIPSFELAMNDIAHFLEESAARFPESPRFLYGHSMGGCMVLNYALKRQPKIAGVVATSPGLATGEPVSPFKLFFANLMYSLFPALTIDNGLDVENLSHDHSVIDKYKNDPLVTPLISSALGIDLLNAGKWVQEHGEDFSIPLLLMQGLGDHIVSPQATERFAARVPRDLLTFREFTGLYHEMHNDTSKEAFIDEIKYWILAQIP